MIECAEKTDEEIMQIVLVEREYFACIIERYEAKLRRYVKRMMPGIGDEADDLLQDIFIKIYTNARGFDSSRTFSSWAYRIAHNEAVSWLRKKKTRPQTVDLGEDDLHTFLSSMEHASEQGEQKMVRDEVARVLVGMREKYRTVLVLKFLEGKNYEEIGDILMVPGGTVATLLHRAKKEFTSLYSVHHG
jgi:RNA polymerase sigma-70 factor (ECF subfamily)